VAVLRDLTRLADYGLLQAHHTDFERRFSILEAVRQFAHERLRAACEKQRIRRLHAEYHLAKAARLARTPVVWGPE
jgi:primosomal protein N''